jgi:nuclear transport factor 2 (NTF2) superfamily protein
MCRLFVLVLTAVVLFGCNQQPDPPAVMPQPVTITVPETPPTTPGETTKATSLEGTWTHTVPGEKGEQRVVLKYIKDQDGPERFEMTQHPWTEKPVFTEKVTSGNETELRFKMVLPTDESQITSHTLQYRIHDENGQWVGTLTESRTETSHPVVLTKSE